MMLEIDVENLTKGEWLIFLAHLRATLDSFQDATRKQKEAITPEWFQSNFRAGYNLVRR